ncbi:aromatic ring-hydroxylating oxygenase subunit alpha [Streptomyces sp. NPDC004227]
MTAASTGTGTVPDTSFMVDRAYFTDRDVWRRELDGIFKRSWLLVAHESEVPSPGDYVTRRMGTDEVIVSRSEGGEIKVLLNACTHRGTLLCKADTGNTAHFRCGYHGWTFANDGSLRGVPRGRELYGPGFDKGAFALRGARVATFYGLIFATFDQELCSLAEYLGDIRFYLECMLNVSGAGTAAPYGSYRFTHLGNWKLEADNLAGDGYHLRHAHRAGFDMGIMGAQAGAVEGVCVQFERGHALRAQRAAGSEPGLRFPGYPQERWPEIAERLSPDQARMFSDSSVVHGLVFPNMAWVHTPRAGGFDPGEPEAAMFQLRLFNPIGPEETEETNWLVTPADYDDAWKASAFKTMQRQHGAASFFESDDLENFRRMLQPAGGRVGRELLKSNFDLATGSEPFKPWFSGPGRIVGSDVSEVNQRWFYRTYLDWMEAGK